MELQNKVNEGGRKTKKCTECGHEEEINANFCGECGKKFGEKVESKVQDKTPQKPTIPKELILKKDGKNALSVKDFLRLSKTMSMEEITEALENSSDEVTQEIDPVEVNKNENMGKDNLTIKKSEKKKEPLEDQKKLAINDFLKVLKGQEILVEFPKDQKDKLIEETTKEIEEAIDADFVDLAMAKGMKKGLEIMKEQKKAKKIEELKKNIDDKM